MLRLRTLTASLLSISCTLFAICVSAQGTNSETPDLKALSDSDLKSVTIKLGRTGCYGTCPIYSLTIHGDGREEYSGQKYVHEIGEREGRVEANAIKSLIAEFAKAEFWQLDSDYSGEKCKGFCTDMATASIQLEINGTKHSVKHYYGCAGVPHALFDLESEIDKIAKSERWTGDVSKAGPMGTTCFGTKAGSK